MAICDQSSYYLFRKTTRLSVAALLTFTMPIATAGCVSSGSTERVYTSSPSGNLVASLLLGSTDISMIADVKTLSESARFRLRRLDGSILKTLKLKSVGNNLSSRVSQIAWSQDEKHVACNALGSVWIIDVSAQTKHSVDGEGIIALRWKDNSTLVFVKSHGRQSRRVPPKQSVHALSLPGYEIKLLVEVESSIEDSGLISNYNNQLSPNAEYLVHYDENVLSVTSVTSGTTIAKFPIGDEPDYWWWNDSSSACVLSGGFEDRTWHYDRQKNSLTEVTAQLKNMSGVLEYVPHPPHVGRVWSANGTWYLVSGIGTRTNADGTEPRSADKDWIYFVEGGSAICVQDEIGDDFWNPSLSPTGDFLALAKRSIGSNSKRGIYVCSITTDSSQKITFGQPKKIYSGDIASNIWSPPYFWSSNGEMLFITGNNGLVSINKEQMQ